MPYLAAQMRRRKDEKEMILEPLLDSQNQDPSEQNDSDPSRHIKSKLVKKISNEKGGLSSSAFSISISNGLLSRKNKEVKVL